MVKQNKLDYKGLDKLPRPPRYSAFVVGQTGNVVGMVRLIAGSDPDARTQAEALVAGHAIELWDGMRYMERFTPIS